jgi:hypothetical protein
VFLCETRVVAKATNTMAIATSPIVEPFGIYIAPVGCGDGGV